MHPKKLAGIMSRSLAVLAFAALALAGCSTQDSVEKQAEQLASYYAVWYSWPQNAAHPFQH